MQNLITHYDNEPVVSHRVIAEYTSNQISSVQKIITDNIADFEEFGRLRFKIEVEKENNQGGLKPKTYLLNEQQATLLMTYLKNTEVVRNFKKTLVKAFYELRANQQNQTLNYQDIHELLHLILYDKRLSAQSKNIYFLLCSKPHYWVINNTEVMEVLGIKQRQTIANYWKELLETGWIDRYRDKNTKNSFVYRLNKEPKEIPEELKKHQKKIEEIEKLETPPEVVEVEDTPLPPPPKKGSSSSNSAKNLDIEQITPKMVEIAKNKGFTEQEATEMFEHFTDYHIAKGSAYVDWDRCFSIWVRNAVRFRENNKNKKESQRANNTNNANNRGAIAIRMAIKEQLALDNEEIKSILSKHGITTFQVCYKNRELPDELKGRIELKKIAINGGKTIEEWWIYKDKWAKINNSSGSDNIIDTEVIEYK